MAGLTRKAPVGAHYGLRDWLAQRVSALVLLAYLLVVGVSLVVAGHLDYDGWYSVFAPQPMKLFTVIAVLALAYHAWIGVRDIWMDYIGSTALRLALHVATLLWLLYCVVWSVKIVWSI